MRWYVFGNIAVMPTRYGTILIDADDLPAVARRGWHVRASTKILYVRGWLDSRRESPLRGKFIYLHTFLMRPGDGEMVDFVNGSTLDCRRSNMRLANKTEDCCNRRVTNSSSGFLGVSKDNRRGGWIAQIGYRGVHKFIGRFDRVEDAVAAREKAASIIHGDFASTLNQDLLEGKVSHV